MLCFLPFPPPVRWFVGSFYRCTQGLEPGRSHNSGANLGGFSGIREELGKRERLAPVKSDLERREFLELIGGFWCNNGRKEKGRLGVKKERTKTGDHAWN